MGNFIIYFHVCSVPASIRDENSLSAQDSNRVLNFIMFESFDDMLQSFRL